MLAHGQLDLLHAEGERGGERVGGSVDDTCEEKENDMAERLVKRVTETYVVVPDDEADDGPIGELDDVSDYEDEEEERKPRRRPAPRPRRR